MASKRYHKLLLIRFFAYFAVLSGFIVVLLEFGPVASAEMGYRLNNIFDIRKTVAPQVQTSDGTVIAQEPEDSGGSGGGFNSLGTSSEDFIQPVSTDYGLVIEKINANAKVIPQVDPANKEIYIKALQEGVAEAKGSTPPGEPGNTFLFSHSTDAPWNIARYNAIFYLLKELEKGDKVIVFYKGRRFDYIVYDKVITGAKDVSYLSNRYDKPVLTLQTCDPPGTTLNRLIVVAKLQSS